MKVADEIDCEVIIDAFQAKVTYVVGLLVFFCRSPNILFFGMTDDDFEPDS